MQAANNPTQNATTKLKYSNTTFILYYNIQQNLWTLDNTYLPPTQLGIMLKYSESHEGKIFSSQKFLWQPGSIG